MNEHHTSGGFFNPYNEELRRLSDLYRWMKERYKHPGRSVSLHPQPVDLDFIHHNRTRPLIIWLGHSAFLLQYDGFNILTDPMLSDRASPFPFLGPRRHTQPAIHVQDLPKIDVVLISHNHYDHLDIKTIRQLTKQQQDPPEFFVPSGLGSWFERMNVSSVKEYDWWESDLWNGWQVTAVPAQHFSGRGLRDRNATLWCGWVIGRGRFTCYFAGDSGYCPYFREIGHRLGPMSISMIPIGAYEPRWFMKPVHANPEDAVKIHQDVRSQFSIGMHWGTFKLTDEDMDEPPKRLREAAKQCGLDEHEFVTVDPGEIVNLETVSEIGKMEKTDEQ